MSDHDRPDARAAADLRRFRQALAAMPPGQGWLERGLRLVIRAWCRITGWRIRSTGTERLPAANGRPGAGCLVAAAPHRAWLEPFLLVAAWPADAAHLVWLADGRTATRSWWRRRLLPRLGVIPIASHTGGPRAYAKLAAEACAAGHAVVVFPEVGPPSAPDRPRSISAGFAYLALGAGAPVVPVVMGGTHHIVRGSSFSVDVLEPLDAGTGRDDAFTPEARVQAHALARDLGEVIGELLPVRTAWADAQAPARDRWRWLATLFG